MCFQIEKPKSKYLYLIIFVVLYTCNAWSGDADIFLSVENRTVNDIQKQLDTYSEKKFDVYLNQTTHYGVKEYHTAVRNLFSQYQKSFSELNTCSKNYSDEEKKYSDKWAKELVQIHGADYVSHHIESIKNLILNINYKNWSIFCKEPEKEGLYSEIQYIITVREFFHHYIQFYNSLGKKEKKARTIQKKTAEAIIKSLSIYPLHDILYGGRLSTYLNLDNKVELKPDVFKFIINHPSLTKPFNPITAYKDLVRECSL